MMNTLGNKMTTSEMAKMFVQDGHREQDEES